MLGLEEKSDTGAFSETYLAVEGGQHLSHGSRETCPAVVNLAKARTHLRLHAVQVVPSSRSSASAGCRSVVVVVVVVDMIYFRCDQIRAATLAEVRSSTSDALLRLDCFLRGYWGWGGGDPLCL